jgi:hypothetical protein
MMNRTERQGFVIRALLAEPAAADMGALGHGFLEMAAVPGITLPDQ